MKEVSRAIFKLWRKTRPELEAHVNTISEPPVTLYFLGAGTEAFARLVHGDPDRATPTRYELLDSEFDRVYAADWRELLEGILEDGYAAQRRAKQAEDAYRSARLKISEQERQIKDLQKQVVRACELRISAAERASRRGVHILEDRIRRLESDLVQVWRRCSAVERKRLEDLANSRGERIQEMTDRLAKRGIDLDDE